MRLFYLQTLALVVFSALTSAQDPSITTLLRDGTIVNAVTIDMDMDLSHKPSAEDIRSCVCRTIVLLDEKDDWRLDSRNAGLFLGGEEVSRYRRMDELTIKPD